MTRRLVILLPLVLGVWAGILHAQPADLQSYLERGRALSKAGKPAQALSYFLLALELGERRLGRENVEIVPLLNALAGLYAENRDYRDATPLYERSLALQEKPLALSLPRIAQTTVALALVYESTDRAEKARDLYQRVLLVWQPALGRNHPSVVTARNRFAALIELGRAQPSPPTPRPPKVTPAPPPPTVTPALPPGAEYRSHLTSIRKRGDAAREWSRLQRLYPTLLKDLSLTVIRVDLGTRRGIYHRIQGGPLTKSEAVARCAAFTARKVWCAVVRGLRPITSPARPATSRPALSRPPTSRPAALKPAP